MAASALSRVFSFWRTRRAPAPLSQSSGILPEWRSLPFLRESIPSAVICLGVFAIIFLLWRTGQFQAVELETYDRFLKAHHTANSADSPVVIIGVMESDLRDVDAHIVPDDVLNETLQKLLAGQPAAIVVDLYRDLPVPGKDPEGRKKLAATFVENPNIIAIQRLGLGNEPSVPPPPFLEDVPEQVGFNDFPLLDRDIDDTVRRVLLIMWGEDQEHYYSDPLLATLLYLQAHDIDYNLQEADPKNLRLGKAMLHAFQPNDGAYINANSSGYQMLVDFRGPSNLPTYSLADALTEKIPAQDIEGKVILIGPMASSLKDFLSTPVHPRFPGIALHAHVIDQLLRMAVQGQPPLSFWREWQETLWLLVWCLAGTLAGSSVRSPLVFISVVAGCLGALAAAFWFSMTANLWLLVAAPAVGFTCTAALSTSHQAFREKKERAVLMKLFSQHVSANVAANIWDHRDQFMDGHRPKSQTLQSTVIFTDLKGFTGTAESLSPEALIDWLNEYMGVMAGLIEQHGGMVNKYMGDAIMAVFGAPIPRTTAEEIRRDATNASRCALAMGGHLSRLNKDWESRGLPTTLMRVGIASGPVVSGSIGGSGRIEYTVTGDTVVIAKRLESLEKASTDLEMATDSCRVLITEQTFSMLDPQFKARKVGPMRLDGKNQTVNVYVLTGENGKEAS